MGVRLPFGVRMWSRLSTRFARCSTTSVVTVPRWLWWSPCPRWLRSERQRASRNHLVVWFRDGPWRPSSTTEGSTGVWVRFPFGVRRVVSTIRSLRSLLDHLVVSVPSVVEERASASVSKPLVGGFETGLGGPPQPPRRSTGVRVGCFRRTARGLDYPLASLAARPPGGSAYCVGFDKLNRRGLDHLVEDQDEVAAFYLLGAGEGQAVYLAGLRGGDGGFHLHCLDGGYDCAGVD